MNRVTLVPCAILALSLLVFDAPSAASSADSSPAGVCEYGALLELDELGLPVPLDLDHAPELLVDGCSGHCYAEINCSDGHYVGCYGSNPDACRVEASYAVCDANYYSCEQCQEDEAFALGCGYCD